MIEIERYRKEKKEEWNSFANNAKNSTFLFQRGYMDYHSDRFEDYSLMFYEKGKLVALLPANKNQSVLYSHQGLTYGGLVLNKKSTAKFVCDLFEELSAFLKEEGIEQVVYKALPFIYAQFPSDEPLYALSNLCKANIVSRDISSVIILNKTIPFSELRRRGKKKASAHGVKVRKTEDFGTFWNILETNLKLKYNSKPVHTLSEIKLLHRRFPDNIQLWAVYENDEMIGGTLLYISTQVVKTQYISASHRGKEICCLDFLFDHLINQSSYSQMYFDMGTSALDHSNNLRYPLLFQKEGFGARAVCCDTYLWQL